MFASCHRINPLRRHSQRFHKTSAVQALSSPYVTDFHNAEEEPDYPHGVIAIPIEDSTKLSASDYRDRLYREISNHKKAMRRKNEKDGNGNNKGSGGGGGGGGGGGQ